MCFLRASYVSLITGSAEPNVSSVRIPASPPVRYFVLSPMLDRTLCTMKVDIRSPKESTKSRDLGLRSLNREIPRRTLSSSSNLSLIQSFDSSLKIGFAIEPSIATSWFTWSSVMVFLAASISPFFACSTAFRRWSVVSPIAEHTTTKDASEELLFTIEVLWRISFCPAREEPPNFITCIFLLSSLLMPRSVLPPACVYNPPKLRARMIPGPSTLHIACGDQQAPSCTSPLQSVRQSPSKSNTPTVCSCRVSTRSFRYLCHAKTAR